MDIISNNFSETKEFGEKLAKDIRSCYTEKAIVISLKGELGAGKTTFVQGFALGLGIKKKILSPTFIIMNKFKVKPNRYFYHFDCYRIEDVKELKALEFKEIISNSSNIVVIEWGEKIKKALPKNVMEIKFKVLEENKRKISYGKKGNICSC
jgi:tRNA threonylcarbamoyladenosine biosynthesis protein TsaE